MRCSSSGWWSSQPSSPTYETRSGEHAVRAERDVAGAEERKALVREIVVAQPLEQLPRARAGDRQHAVAVGHVRDLDRAVVGGVPLDPRQVVRLGRGRGHDVVATGLEQRDGHVGLDAAFRREHLRQCNPALLRREPVGAEAVEQRRRRPRPTRRTWRSSSGRARRRRSARPGTRPRPPRTSCRAGRSTRRARDRSGENQSGRSQPERTPITARFSSSSSYSGSVFSGRAGGPLLLGVVDLVLVLEHLRRAGDDVRGRVRVLAEAADVELPHVVARLPLDDPLRGVAAGSAAEDDAEDREAGEDVQPWPAGDRPHQALAVRCVPVRPVDNGLEAYVSEERDAPGGGHEAVLDLLQVGREQLAVEVVGHAVQGPRLRVALERADEESRLPPGGHRRSCPDRGRRVAPSLAARSPGSDPSPRSGAAAGRSGAPRPRGERPHATTGRRR